MSKPQTYGPVVPPPLYSSGRESEFDAIVIGGGFYGINLALSLRNHLGRVIVLEREAEPCGRASFVNQARVHNGYHYPRSHITAARARVNYNRFLADFSECIADEFEKFYAIPWSMSKVTATQFLEFCKRIGAPIQRARPEVRRLFDASRIEELFSVRECAFDARKLRDVLVRRAAERDVEIRCGMEVHRVSSCGVRQIVVECQGRHEVELQARMVFNCTYSNLNQVLGNSGLPTIPLRHQLAELAVVRVPEPLRKIGITVMDGPFFSLMPFPSMGLHSLSHVRYTHHHEWVDGPEGPKQGGERYFQAIRPQTRVQHMLHDAQRFLPILSECDYEESLFEVKTTLPGSLENDSRPILLHTDPATPGLFSILGAKIDNFYDAQDAIADILLRADACV